MIAPKFTGSVARNQHGVPKILRLTTCTRILRAGKLLLNAHASAIRIVDAI